MLLTLVLVLVAVLAVFLIYVATRPSDFEVARSIPVRASAERIYPHLINTRLADAWMPWSEIDPGAKMVFSGPEEGVGARASWDSRGKLGKGSSTVVECDPARRVGILLEYERPFVAKQDAEYVMSPQGSDTVVTWRVRGKNSFVGRMMCLVMNMDKMIGGTFEQGLAKLKARVESGV